MGEVLPATTALVSARSTLPASSASISLPRRKLNWKLLAMIVLGTAGAAGGGLYYWHMQQSALPLGIVFSNGRVEAEEIDIDTKFPERVAQLLVDEGDIVSPGQIVARMDTRDVEASLKWAIPTITTPTRKQGVET